MTRSWCPTRDAAPAAAPYPVDPVEPYDQGMSIASRPSSVRRSAVAATAVLAVLALSGCGDTSQDSTSPEPSSSEPTASSEPTTERTSEPTESSEPTETSQAPAGDLVQGDGYSLAVPKGWTDLSGQAEKVPQLALADLAYGDTKEAEFASNFNTIVTPANGETLDDEGVRERLAAQVEGAIGVRPEQIDDVELDGERAIGQTATVKKAGATLVQYVTVRDDQAYTLTVTLSDDRAADADAIVGDIVDSWQWE